MFSELLSGTPGDTWIRDNKRSKNGRAAWLALTNHYSGGGEARKNITATEAIIDNIHYKKRIYLLF